MKYDLFAMPVRMSFPGDRPAAVSPPLVGDLSGLPGLVRRRDGVATFQRWPREASRTLWTRGRDDARVAESRMEPRAMGDRQPAARQSHPLGNLQLDVRQ